MSQSAPIDHATPRRKAFSYLRFSTPEQSKGDSFRRQTQMARDYALRHDLDLDENLTFHDLGVSGYRGQNVGAGRLGYFMEAVRVGQVPQGSVLLVEQLDHLTRVVPRKALRVLEDIIEAGVSVVTLNDGMEYTTEVLDSHTLVLAILTMTRANEESLTKSKRLTQAWVGKRGKLREKPLTSTVPAWLEVDRDAEVIRAIPERTQIVRRIFDMTLLGAGQHKIADTLNREGIPTWGRGKRQGKHWHKTYVAKILSNPAVIGTIIPHVMDHSTGRKLRVPLEPVQDYYPAAISRETWDDVQALKAGHVATSKGAPISNILAGLATCPKCESTMTRVQKGKRSLPSFVCTKAKAGAGCEYKSVGYQRVEDRLVAALPEYIRDRVGLEEAEDLEERIDLLGDAIDAFRDQIETLVDELLDERSPALTARLRKLEAELPGMQAELATLIDHRAVMAGAVVGSRISRAIEALKIADEEVLDAAAANRALRGLFQRVVINWPEGTLDFEWKHGGLCCVPFPHFSDRRAEARALSQDFDESGGASR